MVPTWEDVEFCRAHTHARAVFSTTPNLILMERVCFPKVGSLLRISERRDFGSGIRLRMVIFVLWLTIIIIIEILLTPRSPRSCA